MVLDNEKKSKLKAKVRLGHRVRPKDVIEMFYSSVGEVDLPEPIKPSKTKPVIKKLRLKITLMLPKPIPPPRTKKKPIPALKTRKNQFEL